MDKLHEGMTVDIGRSDGRIHSATIVSIYAKDLAVNVQWYENGLSKAKDVGLEALMRLNQAIFEVKSGSPLRESISSLNIGRPSMGNRINDSMASEQLDNTMQAFGNQQTAIRRSVAVNPSGRKSIISQPRLSLSYGEINMEREILPQKDTAKAATSNSSRLARSNASRATQNTFKKPVPVKRIAPANPNVQFLNMITEYRSQLDYVPLEKADDVAENRISVCVRKRPVNAIELSKGDIEVITIPSSDRVIVHHPQQKVDLTKYLDNQTFRFDYVFDDATSTETVYKFTAQPLVHTIFEGGFATCFAYGQTGAGKTHTMGGAFTAGRKQNAHSGIYAYAASDVFKLISSDQYKDKGIVASCTFFEIYGTNVFDLLNKKNKLRVLEDGKKLVQVVDLKEVQVDNVENVMQLIKEGADRRTAGQTSANSNSSRSHAVFQIILHRKEGALAKKTVYGKFSLIDLAGNERGKTTADNDNQQTRIEGAEINKSLLALKECVRAMGRDEAHIPFRGSKLTLILRDSFIGENAKVCMIANITPCMGSVEDTVNTLRYADRVKELVDDLPTTIPPSNGTRKRN